MPLLAALDRPRQQQISIPTQVPVIIARRHRALRELGANGELMGRVRNVPGALYLTKRKGAARRMPEAEEREDGCCDVAKGEIVSQKREQSGELAPGFGGYTNHHNSQKASAGPVAR